MEDNSLLSLKKKRLIDELMEGRESTKMLQDLLAVRKVVDHKDGSSLEDDLMIKIMGSFSNCVSVLSSWGTSDDLRRLSTANGIHGLAAANQTWDHSNESGKNSTPIVKDRRGCYKRRKTEDSRIIIVDTIEDGYAWRKYGQKEILNAKFPRCYFRCTHKHEEGCKALKQVQKLEDGSEMFHITYFGFHTCQNVQQKAAAHVMFSNNSGAGLINYNNNNAILPIDDFEDQKNIIQSPSSFSTITNDDSNNNAVQSEDHHLAPAAATSYVNNNNNNNNAHSSISSLWKDIIGNLEASHDDDIFRNNGVCMDDYYDDFKFDESVFLQV